jgi:hypothetical protein
VTIATNMAGRGVDIKLGGEVAEEVISAVNNSKLAEWRVDAHSQTGLELSFSGCFSTSTLTGGQVVSWGNGYPVVCQFFADYRTQYVVSDANGKLLTIHSAKNIRRPMWFGYIGNGNWTWLGSGKVWDADLSQLPAQGSTNYCCHGRNAECRCLCAKLAICCRSEFSDAFLAELNNGQ